MKIFGYDYLIGDPTVRETVSTRCRIAWFSTVYAFALIGIGSTIIYVTHLVRTILAYAGC